MTDNMKKFLEEASKDREFIEKWKKTETLEAIISLAAEKGFALTPEDLKNEPPAVAELSDDELEAVAGGKKCYCAIGGGGEKSGDKEGVCACVAAGAGEIIVKRYWDGNGTLIELSEPRCACAVGGYGGDDELID